MRASVWACGVWFAAMAQAALGQGYPSQPVKIVVPNPAGGPLDMVARVVAPRLSAQFRQPVLVDNRVGAAGGIGVDAVAKAAPDGHTLLFTVNAALTIAPHTTEALTYDPITDFAPLATVVEFPNTLVVHPQVPATTVAELIRYAREHPQKVTFASGGVGAMNHLEGEMLKSMTGAPMLHVPYKGNAPAMTAVISGEVTFMFNATGVAANYVSAGKARALAITSAARHKMLPDLPTMIESGVPGFEVMLWYGFFGPARLPEAIRSRFIQAVRTAMNEPGVKEQLPGFDINVIAADDLAKRIKAEYALWGKVVRDAGLAKQ